MKMSKATTNKTKINLKIEELEKQSKLIKEELEGELLYTKEKISDLGKIVLGIGGGIVFSILILGGLANRRRRKSSSNNVYKPKKVYHRFRDQIARELTSQATSFLLGIAKDKLATNTEKKENKENDNS